MNMVLVEQLHFDLLGVEVVENVIILMLGNLGSEKLPETWMQYIYDDTGFSNGCRPADPVHSIEIWL